MAFLSNEKLLIVGAGGMIGSNMVQSALMLGLTPNICLYDIYEPGVHGVFDEIHQRTAELPGYLQSYLHDGKLRCSWLHEPDPSACRYARPYG